MKLMITMALIMAIAMAGCPAKKPVATAEDLVLENCFPKSVAKEIKKGNLELVPGSEEEIINPFTGEKLTCPDIRMTDKGREAILKRMDLSP